MSAKKILLLMPSQYVRQGMVAKSRKAFMPPRVLPYLAALTPARFEVRIVNELVDELDLNTDADLVAMSGMLCHIPRAVDLAREYRKRGKKTIIGGVAAYALQDELKPAFDSVALGEMDELWPAILDDFEQGKLKPAYECTSPPKLSGLPKARYDLLDKSRYMKTRYDKAHPMYPVETSRGCPHNCDYCLVTNFFGKKMRYRPIGEVLDEIKQHGGKYIMMADDNIGINPERAKELFAALKPLGIRWLGQFEMRAARNPEMLRLAAESGCSAAFVGIESLMKENLSEVNKAQNAKIELQEVQREFSGAGIPLLASMIFGLDHDTPESIAWTVDQVVEAGVQLMIPWLLTPVPRTRLFERYEQEGRIIEKNWSKYDYWHCVIKPKQMTPEQTEAAYWAGMKRFFGVRNIVKRIWNLERDKFPRLLLQLYYRHKVFGGVHPFSAAS